MAADILSQEEIDALLTGGGSDAEDPVEIPYPAEVEAASTPVPVDEDSKYPDDIYNDDLLQQVFEFFNKAFESAVSVIETIIDKEVSFQLNYSKVVSSEDLSSELTGRKSFLKTTFNQGVTGGINILLGETISVLVADLMMGGDGSAPDPEIDELKQSAINEAFNQMLNSIMTFVSEKINNQAVANTLPEITMSEAPFDDLSIAKSDKMFVASYKLTLGDLGDDDVHFVFSAELIHNFMIILDLIQKEEPQPEQVSVPDESQVSAPTPTQTEEDTTPARSASGLDNLRFLFDVPITYQAVLGKTKLILKEVLELGIGSILELNKLANESVEIYVEDKLIGRGEVVVIDENFGVRIINLVSKGERVELSKKIG